MDFNFCRYTFYATRWFWRRLKEFFDSPNICCWHSNLSKDLSKMHECDRRQTDRPNYAEMYSNRRNRSYIVASAARAIVPTNIGSIEVSLILTLQFLYVKSSNIYSRLLVFWRCCVVSRVRRWLVGLLLFSRCICSPFISEVRICWCASRL